MFRRKDRVCLGGPGHLVDWDVRIGCEKWKQDQGGGSGQEEGLTQNSGLETRVEAMGRRAVVRSRGSGSMKDEEPEAVLWALRACWYAGGRAASTTRSLSMELAAAWAWQV